MIAVNAADAASEFEKLRAALPSTVELEIRDVDAETKTISSTFYGWDTVETAVRAFDDAWDEETLPFAFVVNLDSATSAGRMLMALRDKYDGIDVRAIADAVDGSFIIKVDGMPMAPSHGAAAVKTVARQLVRNVTAELDKPKPYGARRCTAAVLSTIEDARRVQAKVREAFPADRVEVELHSDEDLHRIFCYF